MKKHYHAYVPCEVCGKDTERFDGKKRKFLCQDCNPQPQTQFHNPRREEEPLSSRPLRIVCHNCGSSAEFDIVEQTYRSSYCKQTTGLKQKTEKTNTWRKLAFENQRDKRFDLQRHSCPACGAKVVFQHNESIETCDFCASKLVRSQLNDDEQLPDIIIPFFITEDEAKQRLLEWAKQHKRKKESKNIINHIDKLQAYYLPYRMINGELNGLIQKDGIERIFHCKAHIRNMAVNTSKQLDNLLLNEIEPFDWSKAQNFEYAYIAGHRAKLTDISENQIHHRVLDEAQDEFLPEIQKTFHSRGVDIQFTTDNHLLNKNALLPIYFIKDGDFSAFMNGQTGRISASCGKEKRFLSSWIIHSALVSVISYLLCLIFLFSIGEKSLTWKEVIEISSVFAGMWLFFTILIFGLFAENQKRFILYRRKTQQGSNTKSYRKDKKLEIEENENVKNYHTLVFYEEYFETKLKTTNIKDTVFFNEQYSKQTIPVRIKIFPLKRIRDFLYNLVIFTFFPVIIALIIRPFVMIAKGDILGIFQFPNWSFLFGGFMWYMAFCPFFYLFYAIKVFNQLAYEKPFIYQIMPDGSEQLIGTKKSRDIGLWSLRDDERFVNLSKMLILPALFVLVISILGTLFLSIYYK